MWGKKYLPWLNPQPMYNYYITFFNLSSKISATLSFIVYAKSIDMPFVGESHSMGFTKWNMCYMYIFQISHKTWKVQLNNYLCHLKRIIMKDNDS